MKKLLKNKRGNWLDIFDYSRGALILGISILISFVLLSSFNDMIISSAQNNTLINDTDALSSMQKSVDIYPVVDYILPIIYIFFLGFSIWSASKIESSHKFVFIGLIVLILVTLFAMFVETMWDSFTTNVTITSYVSNFVITNFMLSYLRYFVLFYGLVVGVSLYAKPE